MRTVIRALAWLPASAPDRGTDTMTEGAWQHVTETRRLIGRVHLLTITETVHEPDLPGKGTT